MNFDTTVNKYINYISEHHYGEFDDKILNKTLQDLLDKLGDDESAKDLYDSLETWIKENYPAHVSEKPNSDEDSD